MTSETKEEILFAWNRYVTNRERLYKKNEGSTTQHEDTVRLFKEGIVNHRSLSRKEKEELLMQLRVPKSAQS